MDVLLKGFLVPQICQLFSFVLFLALFFERCSNHTNHANLVENTLSGEGRILYYPFSGSLEDAESYSLDGQGATLTQDRDGNPNSAYYFNGLNTYIDVPNKDFTWNAIRTGFTAVAWIKPAKVHSSIAGVICQPRILGHTGMRLGLRSDNRVDMGLNNVYNCALVSDESLAVDVWSHIGCTWNGITMKIFINGEFKKSKSDCAMSPLSATTPYPMNLGRESETLTRYFHGAIDEVQVFDNPMNEEDYYNYFINYNSSNVWECGAFLNTDPQVCSGHGVCEEGEINTVCVCDSALYIHADQYKCELDMVLILVGYFSSDCIITYDIFDLWVVFIFHYIHSNFQIKYSNFNN